MYLGIDFGTSFSQVGTMYLGNPLLLLSPGEYGIPSALYYDQMTDILVGQDALDAGQGTAAANLVTEVKMKLGQSTVTLDGRKFASSEIVQEIMKAIVLKAVQIARTRRIDTKIRGVVLCIPAKFGMQERKLIRDAAQQCVAGLPAKIRTEMGLGPGENLLITDIIKEPVAAALSYYRTDAEDNKRILVFDLGGGTCDVALVRADPSLMEHYVVEDSDMIRRGGRDWDQRLAGYIADMLKLNAKLDVKGNPGHAEKIRRAAIAVKHKLSDPTRAQALAQVEINGRTYPVQVRRNVFDEITGDLLKETLDCLEDVYDRCPNKHDIEDIICVGGSSNMLQIEEGIRARFPQCNVKVYEPEHAVVNGAAEYAQMLEGNLGSGMQVTDFASFSYGVRVFRDYSKSTKDEVISNILRKGTQLPAGHERYYSPVGRTNRLRFQVYESESAESHCELTEPTLRRIGAVDLLVPGMDERTSVRCRIELNCQGLLEVSAIHPNGEVVKGRFDLEAL